MAGKRYDKYDMEDLYGYTTYDARMEAIDMEAQVFIEELGFSEYVAEQAATRMVDDGLSFDEAVAIYSR